MNRSVAPFLTLALTVATASAQEGILSRTGRALDNAGRGIRNAVETEVARGQIDAEDREVLTRVMNRVKWDKYLVMSTITLDVQPGRTVILRGSVPSAVHKQRAAEMVASTVGVLSVVDELAVVKDVQVIKAVPTAKVIVVTPPAPTEAAAIVKP
jgi:hyperosmotically inducible periplasmic protein